MAEEGFHEIQLNGKQLVFLFMAAAVVAVVVFLSGVMVGRGVRAEKSLAAAGDAIPVAADLSAAGAAPLAPQQTTAGPGQAAGDVASVKPAAPPAVPPQPVAEDVSRGAVLEGRRAVDPTAPAAPPAAARDAGPKPAAAASPATKTAVATTPRAAEPVESGYAVQVAAPKDRAAAESIAKRLVGKGYSAYVLDPGAAGASPVYYRVRVGPFKTRREADEAKRRLEKEEQFKPFITTR
jgi:cell division septation protein DedD